MIKKILIWSALIFIVLPMCIIGLSMLQPEDEADWQDNVTVVSAPDQPKPEPKPLTRKEKIDNQFSLDGAFLPLVVSTRKNMLDPDSFEHIETKVLDQGESLKVWMTYRGVNALGAYVVEQSSAIYYPEENKYEIL